MNINMTRVIILALAISTTLCASLTAQRRQVQERVSVEVIHDGKLNEELIRAQQRFALEAERGEADRFLLMPLASIAYNMLSGRIIEAGQGYVKDKITNADKKYKAEWVVSVSRNYFYNCMSMNGPLDPTGMQFWGIKASRTLLDNTPAFIFSAHIDSSSFDQIMRNSSFNLTLDTLLIDLSKTKARLKKNKKLNLTLDIKITATWMNEVAQYFQNHELGAFSIDLRNLVYDPENPVLVYTGNELKIRGISNMIPRSYIGYVDPTGGYRHSWGQGEYSMVITVKEDAEHKKTKVKSFFNEYLLKVTDRYGSEIRSSSYGTFETLIGTPPQPAQRR